MTIIELKEMINDLPDNMIICADDGHYSMFDNNSEFVNIVTNFKDNICVLQTKNDMEV